MRLNRDALLCDLAETYNIYDIRAVPVFTLARLSCGLRENSRIKLQMQGMKVPYETMLMVAILDDLRWLRWSKSKQAQKGHKAPKAMLPALLGKEESVTAFKSAEEFEKRRAEIIRG